MAIPSLEIEITADSKGAEVAFGRVSKALGGVEQATDDYKRELMELQRAEARGLVTKKQASAALKQIEDRYEAAARDAAAYAGASIRATRNTKGLTGAFGGLGNASGAMRANVQNASFQIADFATQVGAGTSASQALGQQLPQLLGGFGLLGAAMGAVVAVGVPLAASLIDLGGEAESSSDKLDDFVSALGDVKQFAERANTPLDELAKQFGEFADEVQRASEIAARARLSEALADLGGATAPVREGLVGVRVELARYSEALADYNQVADVLGERTVSNASAFDDAEKSLEAARKRANAAAAQLGLTADEAVRLDLVLQGLADAEGTDELARSASIALDMISGMFTEAENIPPEIAKIVSGLEAVLSAAAAAATQMGGMADEAERAVDALPVTAPERPTLSFGGADFGRTLPGVVETLTEDDPPSTRRRGSAGGQQEDRIGALAKSLMTESELVETWRAESLEKLADFNALELEALGGHNEAKLRIEEEYQQRLSELQQSELSLRTKAISEYTSIAGSILSSFASMQDTQNKEQFERQKKMRKAAAVIEGIGAAVAAWRTGMERGGPVLAAAYTAQSVAQTAAQISAISRATYQGGGSIGGAAVAGGGPAPLEVRLSGLSADTIVSGADVGSLLDRLTEEAGDRGYRILTA